VKRGTAGGEERGGVGGARGQHAANLGATLSRTKAFDGATALVAWWQAGECGTRGFRRGAPAGRAETSHQRRRWGLPRVAPCHQAPCVWDRGPLEGGAAR